MGSGTLIVASAAPGSGNPLLTYNNNLIRKAGRAAKTSVLPNSGAAPLRFGWNSTQAAIGSDTLLFNNSSVLGTTINGSNSASIGTWSGSTNYLIVVLLRANGLYFFIKGGIYTSWNLIWASTVGTSPYLFPVIAAVNNGAGFTSDYLKVEDINWLPIPIISDGFSILGTSDGLGHLEGVSGGVGSGGSGVIWSLESTWALNLDRIFNAPVPIGSNLITNPDFETGSPPSGWSSNGDAVLSSVTDGQSGSSGTKAIEVTTSTAAAAFAYSPIVSVVGTWYKYSGYVKNVNASGAKLSLTTSDSSTISTSAALGLLDWEFVQVSARAVDTGLRGTVSHSGANLAAGVSIRGNDVELKELVITELIASVETNTPSVFSECSILSYQFGTQIGLCANLNSQVTPTDFILIYLERNSSATTVKIDKCVSGVYTNLASITITYVDGAVLRYSTRKIDSDLKIRAYYNNALVGTELTISDASITSNTRHGLFSTMGTSFIDNYVVLNSSSLDYDEKLDGF
jgi:hypothetical protein